MAGFDRFELSTAPVKRIKGVQFSVFSPDVLRKYSVAKIDSPETYVSGKPKASGLSDPRLGTVDRSVKCQTDGAGYQDCPGYFGHIELAKPMYHIGFLKTVLKVLRCVGYSSSKLLIDKELDPKFKKGQTIRDRMHRFRYFLKICSTKLVDIHTGGPQPKYRLVGMKIHMNFDKSKQDEVGESERKQELSAEHAYEILKKVSDEDYETLGFDVKNSRPDWFILTVLPVPPPPVRPSVMMDSSARCEDDLTHKLAEIIRANNDLRRQQLNGAPQHIINEFCELLQFHITTYFDNTLPGVPRSNQRSGRPIKSISQRLKGKDGRIRGNLMGKRVDFSARTVISGDANIGIDELGVPWSIALNMTFPETVTSFNMEKLMKLVANGPHPPPGEFGAKYVIRDDGRRIDLRYLTKDSDAHLEIGYKVERHMMDGDIVLFNRQPSLHKMSMMGHKVKILPYSTFRLNLSVTSPYNADFDGDEMNMHLPQTSETKAETMELMMVPKMIVSPQASKPVIGIVQDALLGCRLMTQRDTFIHREFFMSILCHLEDWQGKMPYPSILKSSKKTGPLWSGKQVVSMVTPDINLRREANWYSKDGEAEDVSPEDTQVLIQDGELLSGTLCRKTLGPTAGGLVHIIWLEKGPDSARRFLNNIQYAVNHWLLHHGFSMGIGDTISDEHTMISINKIIEEAKKGVRDVIEKFQSGNLELLPGHTVMGSFEHKVNQVLNTARDDAGKLAQRSLKYTNNVVKMVQAGSKGSFINISQMTACVGQQNVEGKRIPFGFQQRTLPHFMKDDFGPESRGFVGNSYYRGLTPAEFFFHAMGGREGLIDTAVKTSSTGYIQRRLVKAMEDLMIRYDGTVRNSAGEVVQFLYGDDGMDGTAIEVQKIEHHGMDHKLFERTYMIDIEQTSCPSYLDPNIWRDAKKSNLRVLLQQELDQLRSDLEVLRVRVLPDGNTRVHLPVNIRRLIWNAQRMFNIKTRGKPPPLSPAYVIQTISNMNKEIISGPEDSCFQQSQLDATFLFMCHVRGILASKRVLREFKLTQQAFDWIVGEIITRFHAAKAQPGECIGTVAAQSVGEPTTQMTLNTFHYAGVSAKNVTLGVPRLTEIINVAKNIKTPSLSVYLLGDPNRDKDDAKAEAKSVQCQLEFTKLRNVVQVSEIWYDPDILSTVVPEDKDWVTDYYILGDAEETGKSKLSLWVLRIVLNKEVVLDKNLSLIKIAEKINSLYEGFLSLIHTDDNAEELVMRIRIICIDDMSKGSSEYSQDTDFNAALRKLEVMLMDLELQGVAGINRVFIREEASKTFDVESGVFKMSTEYLLDTEGVNLMEVMCQEGVDYTRTVSNHLLEVLDVLGIEAVRAALLKELRGVIEFDGSYGHLMAITRHGINRTDKSPWAQCSFEETVDILLRAAIYAESDAMKGVSENIMLGQLCPLGTGGFELLLNEDALMTAVDPEKLGFDVPDLALAGNVRMGTSTFSSTSSMSSPSARFPPMTPAYISSDGTGVLRSPNPLTLNSPREAGVFSPPAGSPMWSPTRTGGRYMATPGWSPQSPASMLSPANMLTGSYMPGSPNHIPTSPAYPGQTPAYNPASPGLSPTSPQVYTDARGYSPTSPCYSPMNPQVSPGTVSFLASSPTTLSPVSPRYSAQGPRYSPTSPSVSPTSPNYSPTSPGYSPAADRRSSPQSGYTPTSPGRSVESPSYTPLGNKEDRTSPGYSPSSPSFLPALRSGRQFSSPDYSIRSSGRVTSPSYTPQLIAQVRSPGYSPTSPGYEPSSPPEGNQERTSPTYSPRSPPRNSGMDFQSSEEQTNGVRKS
eukprot:g4331.t1